MRRGTLRTVAPRRKGARSPPCRKVVKVVSLEVFVVVAVTITDSGSQTRCHHGEEDRGHIRGSDADSARYFPG